MISLLSFSTSLALIVILIGMKIIEMRSTEGGMLTRLSSSLDPKIEGFLSSGERLLFRTIRAVYKFVSTTLRDTLYSSIEYAALRFGTLLAYLLHKFRGKKTKRKGSAPSFFLKDVSAHKRKIVRG